MPIDGSKKLNVIAVYSNPVRYESRRDLFQKFKEHMSHFPAVNLIIVEAALGDRLWEVTDPMNPNHVQVRYFDEMWIKEAMMNIGYRHALKLDPQSEYFCTADGDISFIRRTWAEETIEALQHYMVVQPWATAIDLDPEDGAMTIHKSFCYQWIKGMRPPSTKYEYMHPGYCWAYRREVLELMGGGILPPVNYLGGPFFDVALIGSGDYVMAMSIANMGLRATPQGISENFKKMVLEWQDRAQRFIKQDIGYVPGTILHSWHGKKRDRQYVPRNEILTTPPPFDPILDIERDPLTSLPFFTERGVRLRDPIRQYLRSRNEDSIDNY